MAFCSTLDWATWNLGKTLWISYSTKSWLDPSLIDLYFCERRNKYNTKVTYLDLQNELNFPFEDRAATIQVFLQETLILSATGRHSSRCQPQWESENLLLKKRFWRIYHVQLYTEEILQTLHSNFWTDVNSHLPSFYCLCKQTNWSRDKGNILMYLKGSWHSHTQRCIYCKHGVGQQQQTLCL